MGRLRHTIVIGFVSVMALCLRPAQALDPPAASFSGANRDYFALIVGVSQYDNLCKADQLNGPANDSLAFCALLTDPRGSFRIPIDHVIMLTSAAPVGGKFKPDAPDLPARPKRDNIEAAYKYLASQSRAGKAKRVIILMTGHGYQQPAAPIPGNYEPDGLDEIFLPEDAGDWGEAEHRLSNAVVDNDLHDWLDAIQKGGAFVWIILDCCHSGSGTRGMSETPRQPTSDNPFHIPKQAYVDALQRSARERPPGSVSRTAASEASGTLSGGDFIDTSHSERIVAFFASRSFEPTFELPMPPGMPDEPQNRYGLFTYNLVSVLKRVHQPLQFRDLLENVMAEYRRTRPYQNYPEPSADGALDHNVFDGEVLGDPYPIRLTVDDTMKVNAGSLSDLTPGSILAVYPPEARASAPPADEKPIGFVKVIDVSAISSTVTPSNEVIDGTRTPDTLPDVARCRVHTRVLSNCRIKLALLPDAALKSAVAEALKDSSLDRFAEMTNDVRAAEVVIHIHPGGAGFLVKPAGHLETSEAVQRFASISGDNLHEMLAEIVGRMQRIYAWRNLGRLADAGGTAAPPKVKLEVLHDDGRQSGAAARLPAEGATLSIGDRIRVQIENVGADDLYAIVYYLGDDFGITVVPMNQSPTQPLHNREKAQSDVIRVVMANVRPERFIVLAVPAGRFRAAPALTAFAQTPIAPDAPALPMTRGGARGGGSPLEELLRNVTDGSGTRGGLSFSPESAQDAEFATFCWTVKPSVNLARFLNGTQQAVLGRLSRIDATMAFFGQGWKPRVNPETPRGADETYRKVAPAVVVIRVADGHGSGFFISEDGLVLTNYHVVSSGSKPDATRQASLVDVYVGRLSTDGRMELDDTARPAEICDVDPDRDLALLRLIDKPDLPVMFVPISKQPPAPRRACVVIGHPSSGMLWTLRAGVVSSMGRWPHDRANEIVQSMRLTDSQRDHLRHELDHMRARDILVTSCLLNPGDSGGPVVTPAGELIGVSFGRPNEREDANFGYAIALHEINDFLATAKRRPRVLPPDPWDAGPVFQVVDVRRGGKPDVLLAGRDNRSIQGMLVDLTGSTPEALLLPPNYDPLVGEQKFRAQFALTLSGPPVAFYDTDGSGRFNLILMSTHADDPRHDSADLALRLDSTGDWKVEPCDRPLVSSTHFKSKQTGARLTAVMQRMGIAAE